MAVEMTGSLGMNANRLSVLGLGSKFDTQALVNMEIQMMELKNAPLYTRQKNYNEEIKTWNAFNEMLTNFQKVAKNVNQTSTSDKLVTGASGVAAITATAQAVDGEYRLEVSQLAVAQKVIGRSMGDVESPLGVAGTMELNGKTLEVTEDMSLQDLLRTVNRGEYGVNAVAINGTLILSSKETGVEGEMVLADTEGSVLQHLGILNSNGDILQEVQSAKNAIYSLDGITMESASNTIQGAVTGVTLTLEKTTTEPHLFTISPNHTSTKESIKKLVEQYNEMIRGINFLTGKGAALQGESAPNRIKTELGKIIAEKTNSSLFLFEAGIELDGVAKDGTILLDETKLDRMLEENPSQVATLFSGENSIGKRIDDLLYRETGSMGSVTNSIEGLKKRIEAIGKDIEKNEASFQQQQDAIIRKYAAFEVMMSQLNFQSEYMTAQIDAMNKKD